MAREHPLDRFERLLRQELKEGRHERKEWRGRCEREEWRKKLKALTDLQARNRETIENSYHEVHALLSSQENFAHRQAGSDESLNAFMDTVKRLINERREGQP